MAIKMALACSGKEARNYSNGVWKASDVAGTVVMPNTQTRCYRLPYIPRTD